VVDGDSCEPIDDLFDLLAAKARAAAEEAGVEDSSSHHMAYLKRIFLYSVFFASYPKVTV